MTQDNTNIPSNGSGESIPDYMAHIKAASRDELIRIVYEYDVLIATIKQQLLDACNLNASIAHRLEYAEHALQEIDGFYEEGVTLTHAEKTVRKAFPFAYSKSGDVA